ncbi:MAG: hypothetical protein LBB84_08405 [Tannerellaceae bacterium]|nr:hypothetical protein [Tannerellaceae bacterium]
MKIRTRNIHIIYVFFLCSVFLSETISAQTEVMAWGNLTGIRVEGQLMEFESSFRVVENGWTSMDFTGRERQPTRFGREGQIQTVQSSVKGIRFEQSVEDKSKGVAAVSLACQSDTTRDVEGVYYCFAFPEKPYAAGTAQIVNRRKVVVTAPGRQITFDFASNVAAFLKKEPGSATTLYVQLLGGKLKKGQKSNLRFTIAATGDIDKAPVEIAVDKHTPGHLFAGLGGNFRLQNPANDPQVIAYCLDNMRVAFGRVELPWGIWQPEENASPIADARAGKLNERVKSSLQMAQRLAAQGMPVIVSAWFPPDWAVAGNPRAFRGGGVAALRLDASKNQKIYQSLADYLVYLKQEYGVEAYAFSFNESDIGINVLHTPQEHAVFIKELGAYMASRGLATKVLLGDNSDATTFDFILPAMQDAETYPYIAAVSFHSWRGCDDETLHKWADAARRLHVPLLVGEGSTDAAAWRYPQILLEPTFALYEINLYLRIAAICQPLSILQWQLTSDYSLLWGAGIYASDGPLRPTQRFWNLKQLASTPENAFALPFTCNREDVNCAAFGNLSRGEYALHVVNNGAGRTALIKGLPECEDVKVYATTQLAGMQEIRYVKTADGSLSVELPPAGFVTLIAKQ